MDTKHRLAQIGGILALLAGSVLGFSFLTALFRRHPGNLWDALEASFVLAFAAYLVFVGSRALRWAMAPSTLRPAPIRWGRTLLGCWLIFTQAKNYFHPTTNLLKPSNAAEALGMHVAAVLLALIGVGLVISGLMPYVRRLLAR